MRKGQETIFNCKTGTFMGHVYAEIELINSVDLSDARRHRIGEEEIRRMRVRMMADSGAYMMAINENIQAYLDLPFQYKQPFHLADDRTVECDVVGPVDVRFANRRALCNAIVLPGASQPLLGAIPMEEMDVLIHPSREELVVNPAHPEGAVLRL
jgi:hypothetical protein